MEEDVGNVMYVVLGAVNTDDEVPRAIGRTGGFSRNPVGQQAIHRVVFEEGVQSVERGQLLRHLFGVGSGGVCMSRRSIGAER